MISDDYNLKKLKKITLKNRGFQMYITPRYIYHYIEHEYEEFTADIIHQHIKPGFSFVDVGAHYGFFSLLVAKQIPKSKVIAIEPVSENFQILKKNIILNKIKNISIYNLAASDAKGVRKLEITEDSDCCGFFKQPLTKQFEYRKVKTISLDKLLKNKKVDFIKIDVEGHELAVLEGAKNILSNENIKLIIELNPYTLKNAGENPLKLLTKLKNFNFEIFLIQENPKKLFRITENLNSWKQLVGLKHVNLFCIKKQKALSVTFFSHSSNLGGAELSLLELIRGLVKRDVIATVILPNQGPLVAELEKLKVPFLINPYSWWCELNKKDDNYRIDKNAWNLENLQEILKFIRLSNPQIIYTNTITIPWGGLISKSLGIPHIWHIHEFGQEDHGFIFDVDFKHICEFINRYSQQIVVNSKAVAKNLSRYLPKNKISVCYYHIDLKIAKEIFKKQIFKKKVSLKLIFVGAFAPGKNQKEAILAAKELVRKKIPFELVLLGPSYFPNYIKEVKNLILKNELQDFVRILNPVKNVVPYLKQADVVLLCSKKEAFGRITVEAMLCQKPVIGAKSGGTLELIKDNFNGFLYPPGNYKKLANKIAYFYRHPEKIIELGNNGYEFAKEKFNEEQYCGKIYYLLKKAKLRNQKKIKFHDLLHKSLLKLLNNKNNQILLLNKEVQQKDKEIKIVNLDIANKEIKLNKCLSDLNRIHNSKTWKLLKLYQLLINQPITIKNKLFNLNLLSYLEKFFSQLKTVNLNNTHSFDLFYFPIIDWHFRFQRPQQICLQLAKYGHRIFYIKPSWTIIPKQFLSKEQIKTAVKINEISPNVFEVILVNYRQLNIYKDSLSSKDIQYLNWSLEIVQQQMNIRQRLAMIAFPFWYPLLNNRWKIIYDCLDELSGFSNIAEGNLNQEKNLITKANLVIYSSQQLFDKYKKLNPKAFLIKNAVDFNYFSAIPKNIPSDIKTLKHPFIGYYGAIADWFDNQLIEYLAFKKPQWQFILIGHIMNSKIYALKKLANVHFLGERTYQNLSSYLYQFDCFIIPFKLNKLILATNPVKAYEVLASGKPIVSVNLPELKPMKKLLYLAKNNKDFLVKIEKALAEKHLTQLQQKSLINKRIEFAKQNTWNNRVNDMIAEIKKYIYPKVSIIVVSHNTLPYLKKCLQSIYQYSNYPHLELIIVDNASKDKTDTYLRKIKKKDKNLKIILSEKNLGFSAGNNLGLKYATGEYIILLNPDTVVTNNWVSELIKYLRNSKVGLVGPITNHIGNEAKVDLEYQNLKQMHFEAKKYTQAHQDKSFTIPMLAFFCVAGKKSLFDKIGLLDDGFTIGFFEDDDYCHRVKLAGYNILCAEDVFIHHFGNKSFQQLSGSKKKYIFLRNKNKYEKKWKIKWLNHKYRQ